jgi:hypothetical protein
MVNKTIAIPGDETNYVVELNVFHLLRCLVSNVIASAFRSVSSQEYRISSDRLYTPITIIKATYHMGLTTTIPVSLAFGKH